jgi:ribose 1,5-bisphosphokinase
MTRGSLVAVVGPSGAGKDTLMLAAAKARPDILLVRRIISRPEDAGGEDFEGVTDTEFLRRQQAGLFALHWEAHGLHYGIPASIHNELGQGRIVLFNGSRGVLAEARAQFPALRVILVTAAPEILAARLAARGRESAADIAGRLARGNFELPPGLDVAVVRNDGSLEASLAAFLAALHPVSA